MSALCVECDAELNLIQRARIGQRIVCPNCGITLEIVSARPLEVDVAYDDGDEWNDMDGYSLDDDSDADDLEGYGHLEGLDDWEDDLDEELDDSLDDELEDDLEIDDADQDQASGRRWMAGRQSARRPPSTL